VDTTNSSPPADAAPRPLNRARIAARLAVFGAMTAGIVLLAIAFRERGIFSVQAIQALAERMGFWGPVAILAAGTVAPIFFVPRWPFAFVCGLLYGIVGGGLLANVTATLGAWLHFELARTVLAPLAARWRRKYGIGEARVTGHSLFAFLFLIRAFPLSNFTATNLLAGALHIPKPTYLAASFLGMIPSTLIYATWGKLMKKPSPEFCAVAICAVAILVLGTLWAGRRISTWISTSSAPPPP
jgi:uncharacterized membrane protein YdjX (TVP38/TMEM64 family)